MLLVAPTEKKAIKGPYSAITSSVKHNLHLAHTLDPVKEASCIFPTPLDLFLYPNIYQSETLKISPSQTRSSRKKMIPIQVLLNKDFIRWEPPLKKVLMLLAAPMYCEIPRRTSGDPVRTGRRSVDGSLYKRYNKG